MKKKKRKQRKETSGGEGMGMEERKKEKRGFGLVETGGHVRSRGFCEGEVSE